MKKTSNSKVSKWLDYLLYAIAVMSIISFLILFFGTFKDARAFHRSPWDWYFFWQPSIEDYVLLIVATLLGILRLRLGILVAFYFVLRTFWFYFDVIFGNNAFLFPDITTYIASSIHYILFFVCLIGLVLRIIEIIKKPRA